MLLVSVLGMSLWAVTGLGAAITKRDPVPSVLAKRADYCAGVMKDQGTDSYCVSYCQKSSATVNGDKHIVGSDIDCTTHAGCSSAHSESYTAGQSFSYNLDVSFGGNAQAITGGANAGADWSWEKSSSTSDTRTFNLEYGQSGHFVFVPKLHKSCGVLEYSHTKLKMGGITWYPVCDWDKLYSQDNQCVTFSRILKPSTSLSTNAKALLIALYYLLFLSALVFL